MTLLTLAQAAADEVDLSRPATLISNSDPGAQKMLRYANKAGDHLMRAYAWQELRREQTFTALAQETQTGILPSDFDRFVPETFWDRTNRYMVSGPVSAAHWNADKAGGYDGPRRHFILRDNAIATIPAFDGGEALAFEYVSNQWCESSGGTGQSAWAADTDVFRLDDNLFIAALVYEWLEGEGQPSADAYGQFMQRFNQLIENDRASMDILVAGDIFAQRSRHSTGAPGAHGNSSII